MPFTLRSGFLAALVLTACTIRVEQPESTENSEAECLELFQTCIELAGESPGCTEVYQFCIGSVMSGGTDGAGGAMEGCEQGYIDCLEEGGDPQSCQPLLDMCMPDPPPTTTTTTGPCIPGEPGCPIGETSDGETGAGCMPGDPDCMPVNDCEAAFLDCAGAGYDESVCSDLQDACENGDCEAAWNVCLESFGDPSPCAELTGCPEPNPSECQQILSDCDAQGLTTSECAQQWPDHPECFPESGQCEWYSQECEGQFVGWFCTEAQEACQQGLLPDVFECSMFFEDACNSAEISDMGCNTATEECFNGFGAAEQCTMTPLFEDPYQWVIDFVVCNGWN